YIAIGTLYIMMIIQSAAYINGYFTTYPNQSIAAFESFNFNQSMADAINQKPQRIVVSDRTNGAKAHLSFYQSKDTAANSLQNIPAAVEVPLANPDTCIITFQNQPLIENPSQLPPTYKQT